MPELIIESPTHGTCVVLYDEEDREIIERHTWHIHRDSKSQTYYVRTRIDRNKNEWYTTSSGRKIKRKSITMHRLITKCPKNLVVDHINHNGLDNRKENLRICTHQQNLFNTRKLAKNSTSGLKGVSWSERYKKWESRIRADGKKKFLGYFNTKEEAARAYDANARHYFGEFACINYPDEKIDESLIKL